MCDFKRPFGFVIEINNSGKATNKFQAVEFVPEISSLIACLTFTWINGKMQLFNKTKIFIDYTCNMYCSHAASPSSFYKVHINTSFNKSDYTLKLFQVIRAYFFYI